MLTRSADGRPIQRRERAAGAPPARRDRRRGAVRRAFARPLRDGRLDLPDHAGRRAGAEERARHCDSARHRARPEGAGAAARRRHQPMRPGHRRRAGDRQQQVFPPHPRAGCRTPHRRGRAGPGARSSERRAEAARPLVSGRCLDQRPGDPRRHGRQQFLRLALDRLRQHGAQRAGHQRLAVGRRGWSTSGRCRN